MPSCQRTTVSRRSFSMAVIAITALAASSSVAQERVPTPLEDNQMLHAFRAMTLQELGLTEDYQRYLKADITFPKQTGITSDEEKKRWIFALAMQRMQLEWLGMTPPSTVKAATNVGFATLLRRVLKTFTPGEIQAVSARWTPTITGDVTRVDPKRADQVATDGESAARALLRSTCRLSEREPTTPLRCCSKPICCLKRVKPSSGRARGRPPTSST